MSRSKVVVLKTAPDMVVDDYGEAIRWAGYLETIDSVAVAMMGFEPMTIPYLLAHVPRLPLVPHDRLEDH